MSLRLSETWFRRGLCLVAIFFALFLIKLGGLIVAQLPMVPAAPTLSTFMDIPLGQSIITQAQAQVQKSVDGLATNTLQLQVKRTLYDNARASFINWLTIRQTTHLADQNDALIARTRTLDALKAAEQLAEQQVEQSLQDKLRAKQQLVAAQASYNQTWLTAQKQLAAVEQKEVLRVFVIRLALTLPLLLMGTWLFAKKRKSDYWPFVWGFAGFAVYTFFVELVPYLPNYGGYVRYSVGIIMTVLLGRYLIHALKSYLDRQRAKEQLPDQERHRALGYEQSQKRLAQRICPGCERPFDMNDLTRDFCEHCGICVFNSCGHCHARKNAFAHFCLHCGVAA